MCWLASRSHIYTGCRRRLYKYINMVINQLGIIPVQNDILTLSKPNNQGGRGGDTT